MQASQAPKRGRPKKEQPFEIKHLTGNVRQGQRLQALALHLEGRYSQQEIATALGCSRPAITGWIKRWKNGGLEALLERKISPPRTPHRFTPRMRAALLAVIPAKNWTTAREAWLWLVNEKGVKICYITVWRFLTSHRYFVGQTPRGRRFAPIQAAAGEA